MILTVQTAYLAHYVERGLRTRMRVTLPSVAAVRLRVADAPEAVLAVAACDTSGKEPRLSPLGGRARRILSLDGVFWRETMPLPGLVALSDRRFDQEGEEGRAEWNAVRHDNPFCRLGREPFLHVTSREDVIRASARGVREWEDDGGARQAELVRARAGGIVVVRGTVYERCGEPCWMVHEPSDPGEEAVVRAGLAPMPRDGAAVAPLGRSTHLLPDDVPFGIDHDDPGDAVPSPVHRFALRRLDDAVAFARGLRCSGVRVTGVARILAEGTDALPDDCLALEHAAWGLLEAFRPHLPGAPRAAALSWTALRDACEASGQQGEQGVPRPLAGPALAEALRAAHRAWSLYDEPDRFGVAIYDMYGPAADAFRSRSESWGDGLRRNPAPLTPTALIAAGRALERWDARPADGREWTHLVARRPDGAPPGAVEIGTLHDARAVGLMASLDLEAAAADAAEGRIRLVAAFSGARLAAVAEIRPSGETAFLYPSGGREPEAPAAAAIRELADDARGAVAPRP